MKFIALLFLLGSLIVPMKASAVTKAHDALTFTATADQAFTGDLAAAAQLTGYNFTLASGPGWLVLTEDGQMMGTPSDDDVGDNDFVAAAADDAGDTTTIQFTVTVVSDQKGR